jgi:hypothetical protein
MGRSLETKRTRPPRQTFTRQTANALNACPRACRPERAAPYQEIAQAERAIEALVNDYEAKWPKAVAKVVDDRQALLAFLAYPAEHWLHLRTTNPIESPSPRSRLGLGHQGIWQRAGRRIGDGVQAAGGGQEPLAGGQLAAPGALVRAGARFEKGRLVERPREATEEEINKVAA